MIIGIGGASRSGKSTLAHILKKRNKELSIAIISQDDYVKSENIIPKINGQTDWEHPGSIDFEKFITAIKQANLTYDVTIAEGLLIFNNAELLALFEKKLFLKIDKKTFLKRKSNDLRWGQVEDWYKEHIWKSHLKFGSFGETQHEVYLIDGNLDLDLKKIEHYLDFQMLLNK